jgi:two-component system, NtrC family, sensor histidine kinase HydH
MLKRFLNKSLRFQIIFVISLVLSVPAAVTLWNILIPSNVSNTVREIHEERVKNLIDYLDEAINKEDIYNLKNSDERLLKIEQNLRIKLEPQLRFTRGTKIGIYILSKDKNFILENRYEDKGFSQFKALPSDIVEMDINNDIKEVIETRLDKSYYRAYEKREVVRYFRPVVLKDEVIAVLWDEAFLPPDLYTARRTLGYAIAFGFLALFLGLFLMIIIVKNQNNNIIKIRNGLDNMSRDLSYRIEDLNGDIGKIAESINSMGDILQKKEKLEEQLARAEKLASLGQMISGVAHEIRNPLGIIRGTVQLMERDFKEVKGLDEYIRIVKEQSDRENRVIQELLDYARPSKQMLTEMDANILIKSVLAFTNKYIQDRHVKLQLKLADSLPKLLLDCDKMKQVFVNIIINACEAMENGGTLCIKTILEEGFVKIYFKDNGIGMDELQLKNLFNPYYTTKPKGTGLGLSISNGIVEMHGGSIEVKSKKGDGSVFIVSIPVGIKDKN